MRRLCCAIYIVLLCTIASCAQASDSSLRNVLDKDRSNRAANGELLKLSASEHAARGRVYLENRHFPEAREHFQLIIDNFADAPEMSYALMGIGRSLMWERAYDKAIPWFERASKEYPATKDGRESLAFLGACNVRLGRNVEAAAAYEKYTVMYPTGERIDSAYLNIIDAYREARLYDKANEWVEQARVRFPGTPTETNAIDGRLRMEIYRKNWPAAIAAADLMLSINKFSRSMVSKDEVSFLKAFALEKSGKRAQAQAEYAVLASNTSYYGGLAADNLSANGSRVKRIVSSSSVRDYPVPFKAEVIEFSRKKGVDPRFVMAIMKQESTFNPSVKSPSAARGLLQLVIDTAAKYQAQAGFPNLQPDDLYNPRTNIAVGVEYIADLKDQFSGLYEAIAASYNGGEDNAARWLARSEPKEAGIFASEIGFAETKNYVFKVMNNYRAYRDLYTDKLERK
ncbi:MAG: transglycosylase SLT domain-containing protein [Acidobacteria bacterium]|nr:transglycosylase SLT domain-containing protein [Acidobacteriota bacterium]